MIFSCGLICCPIEFRRESIVCRVLVLFEAGLLVVMMMRRGEVTASLRGQRQSGTTEACLAGGSEHMSRHPNTLHSRQQVNTTGIETDSNF